MHRPVGQARQATCFSLLLSLLLLLLLALWFLGSDLAKVCGQLVANRGQLDVLLREALRVVGCPADKGRIKHLGNWSQLEGSQDWWGEGLGRIYG